MNGRIVKVDLINPGKTGKQLVIATDESGEVHLLFESPVAVPNNSPVVASNNGPVVKRGEPRRPEDRKAARAAFPRPPSVGNGGLLVCNKGHDLTLPGSRGRRKNGAFYCRACNRSNLAKYIERQYQKLHPEVVGKEGDES